MQDDSLLEKRYKENIGLQNTTHTLKNNLMMVIFICIILIIRIARHGNLFSLCVALQDRSHLATLTLLVNAITLDHR